MRVREGIKHVCFASYSILQLEMPYAMYCPQTKEFVLLGLPQAVTGVLVSLTIASLKYK